MINKLRKEYISLGCWDDSCKNYKDFMNKCNKLGYAVWEDTQFVHRVVIRKCKGAK
jgi:hypothetical protein